MARVLFVQKKQLMQKENIGIMQISSVLKSHGHQCDLLLAENSTADLVRRVKSYSPDIVGFSVMTIDAEWVLEVASLIRYKGMQRLTVAGGPHPTFFPDFLENDCIDVINVGEGEHAMRELADAMDNQKDFINIENLHVKRDGRIHKNRLRPLADINQLPFPDRDMYLKYKAFRKQKNFNFIVSRGCPYDCSFCFMHQWRALYKSVCGKGDLVRLREVDLCIEEITEFSKKVDISTVSFVDSSFNLEKEWTIAFLRAYGQTIGIPFTINVRPNLVDEDIVKAIADTKCCQSVRMGIEVGSEKLRHQLLRKKIKNEQIYRAAELLRRHGIRFVVFTMYGLPGETLEDALETIEMARKLKPFSLSVQLFHPYPGLDITRHAIEKGYLRDAQLLKLANKEYRTHKSILKQPEIDEVVNLLKLSILAIRLPLLLPVIRRLTKRKPNALYDLIYMISAYLMLRKYTVVSIFNR